MLISLSSNAWQRKPIRYFLNVSTNPITFSLPSELWRSVVTILRSSKLSVGRYRRDWEGLIQLRKRLRRPEPCNMCCNGLPSSDSWINIMGRRKLFYPTFMSLVFERILREKDSYRKVIVLEEALYCESGFLTLTATPVPHNPAVAVCRWTHLHHHVWYETNETLRSWWHYQ